MTLVVARVLLNIKDSVKLPKFGILKDLYFYLASILIVCFFGILKFTGTAFLIVYFLMYILYILCSIYANKIDNALETNKITSPMKNEVHKNAI